MALHDDHLMIVIDLIGAAVLHSTDRQMPDISWLPGHYG